MSYATIAAASPEAGASRDTHLFGGGHKRILSLDGGGIRGIMTIAFLERLERIVEEIEGRPVLLGDWFDLIGGTSTGAIIASGLALGYRASEIRDFYSRIGPRVFRPSILRMKGLRARFDARELMSELQAVIGSRTLDSSDIRTGLCIVTKRIDTGSTWIVMNNPRSAFWETPDDSSFIGNRHYPLVNIIRASTAAPHYFDPEPLEIVKGAPFGLFVDGGVSPHNSPALHLAFVATLPPYGLCWPLGVENMTVISIGTGFYRPRIQPAELPWLRTLGIAVHALTAQVSDAQHLVLMLMSWLGHSPVAWEINSELGDLGQTSAPFGRPLFNFLRYDALLEKAWLAEELGIEVDARTLATFRRIDLAENMPAIYELGMKAADRQIRREHVELARPTAGPTPAAI